jgi:hypothetical protein
VAGAPRWSGTTTVASCRRGRGGGRPCGPHRQRGRHAVTPLSRCACGAAASCRSVGPFPSSSSCSSSSSAPFPPLSASAPGLSSSRDSSRGRRTTSLCEQGIDRLPPLPASAPQPGAPPPALLSPTATPTAVSFERHGGAANPLIAFLSSLVPLREQRRSFAFEERNIANVHHLSPPFQICPQVCLIR